MPPARPPIHFSEFAGVRNLHVGGTAIQSSMCLDVPDALTLAYTRTMLAALLFVPQPREVLMIGLGAGSQARFMLARVPSARVCAVEVDLRVVQAAHRHFKLPVGHRRLKVLVTDGALHAARHRDSYDLLLLDAFLNHRQAPSVRTETFYRAARAALRPGGIMAVNYMTDDPGLRAYVGRLDRAFEGRIACLRVRGEGNLVVLAFADDPGAPTPRDLARRARALEARYGLEFRDFAARLRRPSHVWIGGRRLLTQSERGR